MLIKPVNAGWIRKNNYIYVVPYFTSTETSSANTNSYIPFKYNSYGLGIN